MPSQNLISLLISSAIAFLTFPVWGQSNTTPEITFFCEDKQDVPVTVARNSSGITQTIFHWKNDALFDLVNLSTLCTEVSKKLNDYAVAGNDLSTLEFGVREQVGLPTICVTGENSNCHLILFTLAPTEKPLDAANGALSTILNRQILTNQTRILFNRNPQSVNYQVNLF